MSELDPALLYAVSEEVMGDCAFLVLERHDDAITWPDGVVQARVGFSGVVSGTLTLQVPATLAVTIASDMLGIEADDPAATQSGGAALAELSNVLLGVLLERWLGGGAHYDMALPEVLLGTASLPGKTHAATFVDENGHPLRAVVTVREGEAA